jgi:uncharacterized BrkB/YihY/UPF0761 family membrane protein
MCFQLILDPGRATDVKKPLQMPPQVTRNPCKLVGATTTCSRTAALFTIGKFLIRLYIGKTGVGSGFGAAGSIAVVFVWVYYSAQIFLLGAEFT